MSYHVVEKLFSEYDIRNVVVCFNISISVSISIYIYISIFISISVSICCDFFFSSCISICF
ncbi:TPA: hypothetical protein ACHK3I_004729 [Escherichia coli]|uniref:hypothetical protein n=1 Tax=Escherichia coli TaxID=562 RepID=UPI000BDEAE91|nr:hypothetical protein [Escherichia coli]MCM5515989.1 hypothetical protein [Escherichia coli]